MVVRDLWIAVWRLARLGGEDCHAILVQLAAKWTHYRETDPSVDRPLNPDESAYSQLKQHIKLSKTFATALRTTFARSIGVRMPRRTPEEKKEDQARELDGDSSGRLAKVWEIWERANVPHHDSSALGGRFLDWAWNQRSASAPPLPPMFRRHALEPLDRVYVVPEDPPKSTNIPMPDWPFVKADRTRLRPWPEAEDESSLDGEEDALGGGNDDDEEGGGGGNRRSVRLEVRTRATEGKKGRAPSVGGRGGSKRHSQKKRGGAGGESGRGRREISPEFERKPKIEEGEGGLGRRHPVWDLTGVIDGPREDASVVEELTVVTVQKSAKVRFYNGMVRPFFLEIAAVN